MRLSTPGLRVLTLPFDHEDTEVLVASYLSHRAAREDRRAVLGCGAYLHGAILVGRALDGRVSLEQTDHMVGEGARGLGTVGLLAGLLSPSRMLLTTGFGAVLGGALGEALHLLSESRVRGRAAELVPLGCAGLVVAYPRSSGPSVQPVVTRAITTVTGEGRAHHLQALKAALADAPASAAAVRV